MADGVIYQIYPRSSDGNGDGIGDPASLKIGLLASWARRNWLSPSILARRGFRYDVHDYCAIDPKFGQGDSKLVAQADGVASVW